MTVQYKAQQPIYPSAFLEDIITPQDRYKVTFLGNHHEQNMRVDLYLVKYEDGSLNSVYQYDENIEAYCSGVGGMYNDVMNGVDSAQSEIYKRAIKEGLLKESFVYIGYSELYQDNAIEEYFGSKYYEERPLHRFMEDGDIDDLSEDEDVEYEKDFNLKVEAYDKQFIENVGPIPKDKTDSSYHTFESLDEARNFCSDNKGIFNKFSTTSDAHTEHIGRNMNFTSKFLYEKIKQKESDNDSSLSV